MKGYGPVTLTSAYVPDLSGLLFADDISKGIFLFTNISLAFTPKKPINDIVLPEWMTTPLKDTYIIFTMLECFKLTINAYQYIYNIHLQHKLYL